MSISRRVIEWLEQRLNLTEIFSFVTTFGLSYVPIDLNKRLEQASKEAFERELPAYTRGPYVLGVLTFLLFVFQGVSGLMLAFYYEPSPQTAYESTLLIVRDVNFGWYVHQMHYWGSNVLLGLLAVRLVRFFVHGVYKPPRELFWLFGVVLFLLSIHAALTGTLLPWDQQAYWSVTRVLEVIGTLPIISSILSFLIGGFDISQAMLIRFYVLHVIVIPLFMISFFYLHFATVRKVGLSPLLREEKTQPKPLYPDHLFRVLMLILTLFGVILTLGTVLPSAFWQKADPFTSPKGMTPPWYLMPAYGLMELLPPSFAGLIMLAILIGLVVLPFIERAPDSGLRKRPVLAGSALVFCLLLAVLTYIGYRRGR